MSHYSIRKSKDKISSKALKYQIEKRGKQKDEQFEKMLKKAGLSK